MSDSDSDCVMVKVKSIEGYKFAPKDKDYLLKIKPKGGKKSGRIYTLREGQSLPYAPNLEGLFLLFLLIRCRFMYGAF